MRTNAPQQLPFIRESRKFPQDIQALVIELTKSYIELANFINARTIGIYVTNSSLMNGETWAFTGNQPQNAFRQVYTFTSAGNIPHGLTTSQIYAFTRIYGTFTDGTNFYPLPYVDVVNATNQVNVKVTPTNIVITSGAGVPPAITSGIVVLEWISNI